MQLGSLHSLLFPILLLFVVFSDAKDTIVYANESLVSSRPVWTTSKVCLNSHYLNLSGDEVSLPFVGTRLTIHFESSDVYYLDTMFARISINNTDVATVNTCQHLRCTPITWTSRALPLGRHILQVTQMNNSDHVYIRSFSFTSSAPKDELKCYGLPYGALGFVSHLLALYSFLCLINRRRAYFPWSRIKPGKHTSFDILLSVITFVVTVSLTSITMARCKNNWQYVLLGVENLCLSIAISATSLSSSLDTSIASHTVVSFFMCLFAFIGGVIGAVGYISLIVENWSDQGVRRAFSSILGAGVGYTIMSGVILLCSGDLRKPRDDHPPYYLSVLVFMHLAGVSMGDWVLGVIADDLSGIPHGKIAVLIWLYFAIRRLPMLVS